ncbi:MAG: ABC transporter permease [Acetivibrionales bacterium]
MIFHIAFKDLKIVFRDKKALAVMLLMPVLIILILGTALNSMFSQEPAVEKFSIGVVNKDKGFMSNIFINQVLRNNISGMFETYVVDENKAEDMLRKKTVPSVIVIPGDFTENLEKNYPVKLQVRFVADKHLEAMIVKSVAESFVKSTSLGYAAANAVVDKFKENNIQIKVPLQGMPESTTVVSGLQKLLGEGLIEFEEADQEVQKTLSAIQYYSASMLVMFILFGANMGTRLMLEERESGTLGRIMSARPDRAVFIFGKFLGIWLICLLQASILIIFTHFAYGVNWGSSLPGVIIITICTVFTGAAFGMFIGAVAKTTKAADSMGMVLIQMFTMLGGGMIPYYFIPESIKRVAGVTLNWWAIRGYHELMLGADTQQIIPFCGILMLMGLAYLGTGILRIRLE